MQNSLQQLYAGTNTPIFWQHNFHQWLQHRQSNKIMSLEQDHSRHDNGSSPFQICVIRGSAYVSALLKLIELSVYIKHTNGTLHLGKHEPINENGE